MTTFDELLSAFAVHLDEMQACKQAHAYWALLHLAVVMPDMCAALEHPEAPISERYINWCDQYFPSTPKLTAADRFQMRNALLHEGSTATDNRSKVVQRQSQYRSFSFVDPREPVAVHLNVSSEEQKLVVDVGDFADETVAAVRRWLREVADNPERSGILEPRLKRLARRQREASGARQIAPNSIEISVYHATTSST